MTLDIPATARDPRPPRRSRRARRRSRRRVYLSKDARLAPGLVPVMSNLDRWRGDPCRPRPRHVLRSDMDRRLGLTASEGGLRFMKDAGIGPVGARPRRRLRDRTGNRARSSQHGAARARPRRKPETLDATANELRAAGASEVVAIPFDATDFGSHEQFVHSTFDRFGDFDVVLLASESSATSRERRSMPQPRPRSCK